MHYLGRFFHLKKKLAFDGLYKSDEALVYPIESIFYPNKTGSPYSFNQLHPILFTNPSKIIGVGKNYKSHIKEFDSKIPSEPIIFLKSPSAVIGPSDKILLPKNIKGNIEYEGEVAIVIKKKAEKISEKNAPHYILGYTCANDITARELQKQDGQWTRAKGFKTFCPLGPWILPYEEFPRFQDLSLKTYVNNKLVQSTKTSAMLFNIPYLISFISQVMTLNPGDIILTGTPSGVGPLKANYNVEVEIEQIGSLINSVTNESKLIKNQLPQAKSEIVYKSKKSKNLIRKK